MFQRAYRAIKVDRVQCANTLKRCNSVDEACSNVIVASRCGGNSS